jgi:hypothetical protein
MEAPPYMAADLCPVYLESLYTCSVTWDASSLVGAMTSAEGRRDPGLVLDSSTEA